MSKKILLCAALGLLLWALGYGLGIAIAVPVIAYLISGGGKHIVLVLKTLPRDLRAGFVLLSVLWKADKYRKGNVTIVDIFDETVAKHPNKAAVLFEKQKLTFRELQSYTHKVANYFAARGFKEGDCVAIYLHNCAEYVGLWLGLSRLGVSAALINYNLRAEVLQHTVRVARARAVVCSQELAPHLADVQAALKEELGAGLTYLCLDGCVDELGAGLDLGQELAQISDSPVQPRTTKSFSELLLYIYTSGTTGPPKAAKIMNHRFHFMADGLGLMLAMQPSDVLYCSLPLYHSNGGILGAGQMVLRGCTLVVRKKFSASRFWEDCITYGCTVVQYIGEVCRYLLSQPKKPTDNQHYVRLAVGNGLKRDFWKVFQERFNIPQIGELYGATEGNASIVNTTNRVGSCGFNSILLEGAHPLTLVKFDMETGEVVRGADGLCQRCAAGQPGLMVGQIRQTSVHKIDGYGSEEATRKKILTDVLRRGDQYFNTGDVLTRDEEGYFYFCDRTGDTFRWKGENVSTFEVESVMSQQLENRDVIVYGVEVPGCEGRAGMAAVVDPSGQLQCQSVFGALKGALPAYAVPLFIRSVREADTTGTSKYKKTALKKEGFNVRLVGDPVFFLHPEDRTYVPLTEELLQDIEQQHLKL